jgi:CTP synthase (UTP-ammonia lyase)
MFHNSVRETPMKMTLAIVGDFNSSNSSHIATNDAIIHSSTALGISIESIESRWVGTEELAAPGGVSRLQGFDGVWIAPASPYRNMDGSLSAIRMARERRIPLLGTCGGFQHIFLEYARNVLGFADAEHEESNPNASRLFISRLACSLVGRSMTVRFQPGSLVARLYGRTSAQEQYRCNFGVNPAYAEKLQSGPLRIVGSDDEGVARVVELAEHPFFVGTLFIPQLTSTPTAPHPVVSGFLQACLPGVPAGAVLPASGG